MDYQLDHSIRLNENTKRVDLYKWSLNENRGANEPTRGDLVPWEWSLLFSATELKLIQDIEGEDDQDYVEDYEKRVERPVRLVVSEEQRIRARLRSGVLRDGQWEEGPSYSMLGTLRNIEEFVLNIRRLPDKDIDKNEEQPFENSLGWCILSYTDFESIPGDGTQSDVLGFDLYLKPERFDELARLVRNKQIEEANLSVYAVPGFYGEWTPDPLDRPWHFKVLGSESQQGIVANGGCNIDPPRLVGGNNVREFSLDVTVKAITQLSTHLVSESEETGEEDWEQDEEEKDPRTLVPMTSAKAEEMTREILVPLWILTIAMVVVAYHLVTGS